MAIEKENVYQLDKDTLRAEFPAIDYVFSNSKLWIEQQIDDIQIERYIPRKLLHFLIIPRHGFSANDVNISKVFSKLIQAWSEYSGQAAGEKIDDSPFLYLAESKVVSVLLFIQQKMIIEGKTNYTFTTESAENFTERIQPYLELFFQSQEKLVSDPSSEIIVTPGNNHTVVFPKIPNLNIEDLDIYDPTAFMFREAGRVPLLTEEQEIYLAKQIEAGKHARKKLHTHRSLSSDESSRLDELVKQGKQAKEYFVRANSLMVIQIAKEFMGRGVLFSDLIQEGNIGLQRAVEKFNYRNGNKFYSYGRYWVREYCYSAVAEQARLIKIPRDLYDKVKHVHFVESKLIQELQRTPTIFDIARRLTEDAFFTENHRFPTNEELQQDLPSYMKWLTETFYKIKNTFSIDTPYNPYADNTNSPEEYIENPEHDIEYEVDQILRRHDINRAFTVLSDLEKQVIQLRYGLQTQGPYTYDEIAGIVQRTIEGVRVIEKRAIKKLQKPDVAHILRAYANLPSSSDDEWI